MNTQYMQLGSQAMAFGPLAGGIGMAAGLGADLLVNQQAQQDQLATMKKDSKDPLYTQPNPYAGQGYGQNPAGQGAFQPSLAAFSGLRMGGAVPYADSGKKHRQYSEGGPVGHVIPANKVGKAASDAKRIGLNLGANAVPGTGGPTADDVPMKQPGAEPAAVSSGEMYVHDDIFEMLARGAGMTSEGYAGKMYPNSTAGFQAANGGQVPPTDPPKKLAQPQLEQAYQDSSVMKQYTDMANDAYRWAGDSSSFDAQGAERTLDRFRRTPEYVIAESNLQQMNGEYPLRTTNAAPRPTGGGMLFQQRQFPQPQAPAGYRGPVPVSEDYARKALVASDRFVDRGMMTVAEQNSEMHKVDVDRADSKDTRLRMQLANSLLEKGKMSLDDSRKEVDKAIINNSLHKAKFNRYANGGMIPMAMGGGLFGDGGPGGPPYKEKSMLSTEGGLPGFDPAMLGLVASGLGGKSTDKGMMWDDDGGGGFRAPYNDQPTPSKGPAASRLDQPIDAFPPEPKDISAALLRPTQSAADDMLRMLPRSTSESDPTPQDIIPSPVLNRTPAAQPNGGQPKSAAMPADKGISPLPAPEGDIDPQKLNRNAAIGQGIAAVGSLAYNLFRERDSIPKPQQAAFQPLDLNTEALAANLQGQRARATNTAVKNNRGDQGEGRSLAIHANNESQAQDDAMTVEGVENDVKKTNNAGVNQVGFMNTQANNTWQTQEALVNDQFRRDKMVAVNQSLAAMGGITGDYLSNRMGLQSDKELEKFRSDYLKYLAGAKGYENMAITSLGGTV